MISNINNFFDHILCLNLNDRQDRWEESQAEFNKHNIQNVEKCSAIRGTSLNLPLSNNVDENGYVHPPHMNGVNVGAIGCGLSHLFAIKTAKRSGYKNILILEDDVCFHDNLNVEFDKVIEQLPSDWCMLYFGGNHLAGKPVYYTDNLYSVTNTVALHAVAVNHTMYDKLITALTNITTPPDCNYAKLQITNTSYVANPHLAWQRAGYSDIQTSVQGYEFMQTFESAQH